MEYQNFTFYVEILCRNWY